MQKDWDTTGTTACSALPPGGLVTQPVWEPAPVRSAGSGCGPGFGSLLLFVRQAFRLCLMILLPVRDQ